MGDDGNNVVPFPRRGGKDVERQILDGEIVEDPPPAARSLRVANPHRLHRPAWFGFSTKHRRALRFRLAELSRDLVRVVTYWPTRGLLEFAKRLTHWWWIGWGCWLGIARWVFAVWEHTGSAIVADDKHGKNRGRQVVMTGWDATKLMGLRLAMLVVPHIGLWAWLHTEMGWPYQWLTAAPITLYQIIWGSQHDTKPLPAAVAAPRARQDVTIESMTTALRALGVLDKPTPGNQNPSIITLADLPDQIGTGKLYRWDLPADCSKSAEDVIRLAPKLAGTYALPRAQFVVELGNHEYQFTTWISRVDPFAGPLREHPCATMTSFDGWQPAPFGHDPMGRTVYTAYPFTSHLISARPRVGKSFCAMCMLVPAVLDPSMKFVTINLKGDGTWRGLKPLSEVYISGKTDEDIAAASLELERLTGEVSRRNRLLSHSSKLTKEISELLRIPLMQVVLDEAQEVTTHPIVGDRAIRALTTLAKVGPSCGISLWFITQRPDDKALPTSLRAAFGEATCLQVKNLHDSNIALGTSMSKMGYDASKIRRRAVGIHVPDSNNDAIPDDPITANLFARTVRTFDMGDDGEIFNQFCQLGFELRGGDGAIEDVPDLQLEDEFLTAAVLLERMRERVPSKIPSKVTDEVMMGRWLASLDIPSRKHNGERIRPRSAVETVLHLSRGALAPLNTDPGAVQVDGSRTVPDSRLVGVVDGSFQDQDTEE